MGMIEYILIRGANMTGYLIKGRWVLLKLLLSRRVIFTRAANTCVDLRRPPKHGGDGPFLGSLVAVKLAPLGNKLMLLALAKVLGPKLGLNKGVIGLRSHVTCPLRDYLLLLDPGPL